MARVTSRQVWLSVLVILLFAPVVLASGSPSFRPAWYPTRAFGIPLSVWLVVGLIVVFVCLVALFARAAFGAAVPDEEQAP